MKLTQAITITKAMIKANMELDGSSNSAYLCPMWWSLPGEGKSTAINQIGEDLGLEVRSIIASSYDAGEFAGYPMLNKETMEYTRARPSWFPTEGEGIIFFDEGPQAPTALQNLMARVINERELGEFKLPKGWSVVMAGNPLAAKAGTNTMPTHLKDRMTHLDIETDHEGFREYALANGFLPEVTGFVNERPEWLQKFDPKQNASPSPRSWERVNSILKLGLPTDEENHAIKGQVGEGALADFAGYKRIWRDLPKFEEIMRNPTGHAVPQDPSVLYALCSSIAYKTNKQNVKDVITYIKRFENKEFTAFCMKDTLKRHPELMTEKTVSDWFMTEGRELML